jgi:PBP/GOBP family
MKKLDKNVGSDRNYDEYEDASSEESSGNRNRNSYIGANPRYRRVAWSPNRYETGYDQRDNARQDTRNSKGSNYQGYDSRNQTNEDMSEHDRSCIIQCFLQEMKMTNTDGFPDKHKANQILTKDIRDRQLKDFFSDTIQECFHVLDLDKKRDKCDYSRNLVNCFAERGKMNCDDWQDDANGLFY